MTVFSASTKESAKITKDLATSDLKSAANDASRSFDSKAHNIVDDVAEYANRTGKKVRRIFDEAGNELHHASDFVKSEINTNPVRSVLIAAGVGALLGMIIRR